ncbi:thialysine N-epsilon-acetyltransferase-like [Liolophura sinensis]|uniref:thialysine N-epsilon-acetyltransferase-like n=1 Tax=Liolophura sinensis TaxID=3198878 RepID=UPI003158F0AB
MSDEEIVVRPAVKTDCAEIARLIKELGEYENLGDQVKMTKEVLEKDGFGEYQYFRCLVADKNNYSESEKDCARIIGYALYFFIYSTFEGRCVFMEDLYVSPQYRARGIGTRLMKGVAKVGVDKGCSRLCWNVLDWNAPSIAFYKRLGAVNMTETEGWHTLRLNKPELEKLANR